jgi:hypothetical protein
LCFKLGQCHDFQLLASEIDSVYTEDIDWVNRRASYLQRAVWRHAMLKKLECVAFLMSILTYASAATVSIGTASARGDMRVDSYVVKGNATLFDGTVVETGQATADLRLDKGTQITMSTGSRGTLYRDRLVLQQGKSMMSASSSFQLEANGLLVTPKAPNSLGVVTLKEGNAVEVAALSGSFGVTDNHGVLIASVPSGHVTMFALQQGSENTTSYSSVGTVSFTNAHYFLTDSAAEKFEITCKDFRRYIGKEVKLSGTIQTGVTPAQDASSVVCVKSVSFNGSGLSVTNKVLFGSAIGYTVAGVGIAVYEANQSSTAASP